MVLLFLHHEAEVILQTPIIPLWPEDKLIWKFSSSFQCEDDRHTLCDCIFTKQVWDQVPIRNKWR